MLIAMLASPNLRTSHPKISRSIGRHGILNSGNVNPGTSEVIDEQLVRAPWNISNPCYHEFCEKALWCS